MRIVVDPLMPSIRNRNWPFDAVNGLQANGVGF
jgi:hypothetical protein